MKVEKYMFEPAFPWNQESEAPLAHTGLTKLEWMAGQIASGSDFADVEDNYKKKYSSHIVDQAICHLEACHEAEVEDDNAI